MKKVIKHLRIAVAQVFYSIANFIDDRDIEDLDAELRRIDPTYQRCSNS